MQAKESCNPKWCTQKPLLRNGWTIYDHDLIAGYTVTDHGNVRLFSKKDGKRLETICMPYDFAEMIHKHLQSEKP